MCAGLRRDGRTAEPGCAYPALGILVDGRTYDCTFRQ